MFYIFQGEDSFSCAEELASLKTKMGDPTLASLNITQLDGRTVSLNELEYHCSTVPFLAERRLVIVKGLLERLGQRGKSRADQEFLDALISYLPQLPSTTRLVFWEESELPPRHPVVALAADGQVGYIRTFQLPTGSALGRWIRKRVKDAGGHIANEAVEVLSAFVGSDLYQLAQEIPKLVAFTGGERPITEQDVRLLTSHAREASIFDMVDALGRRDGKTASQLYHQLLDLGEHPLSLLGMITRQFRLLIQVKELSPRLGTAEAIARELKQNPYPIKKILQQSANYTMPQLHVIYHKLLDTDLEIKTGQMDETLALDLFIAGLSRTA